MHEHDTRDDAINALYDELDREKTSHNYTMNELAHAQKVAVQLIQAAEKRSSLAMTTLEHIDDAIRLLTLALSGDGISRQHSAYDRVDKAIDALKAAYQIEEEEAYEPTGCLACGRNEWGYGTQGAYCHRHADH